MTDLHYAPPPNGWKISIMPRNSAFPARSLPFPGGDQFKPEFLAISPNKLIPAIVDHAPADGGEPFSILEEVKRIVSPHGEEALLRRLEP
jgi:GST-like protein